MAENNMKVSSGAVEQIIDNMTSDIHNADGQFIQLGFTPPPTPNESWNIRNKFVPPYHILNNIHNEESSHLFPPVDQFNPHLSYNYVQQQGLYNTEMYEKRNSPEMKQHYYDIYQNVQNKPEAVYSQNHNWYMPDAMRPMNTGPSHIQAPQDELMSSTNCINSPNRNHLIENLVGNWASNTSGTYNPFGNVPLYNPNIFDSQHCLNASHQEEPINSTEFTDRVNEEVHFQFSRDNKKPRIVAEVKPMRPSYSDVLLKSVPQNITKNSKSEIKENKIKKESKKSTKNEKLQKLNNSNSTRNIIVEKEVSSTDKTTHTSRNTEKPNKETKPNQLNRKWSSLDNVTDTFSEIKTNVIDNTKMKKHDENVNKYNAKINAKKVTKNPNDFVDNTSVKTENISVSRTTSKKNKLLGRPRSNDSFGNNDRPPGKRSQRNRKRENHGRFGFVKQKLKSCLSSWWKIITSVLLWLVHLVFDICSLSMHLSKDLFSNMWSWLTVHWFLFLDNVVIILKRIRILTWIWDKIKNKKNGDDHNRSFKHAGLQNNINMPTTGEEAMKRLLACKGKDPYSILGVTPACTDEDIKKYYKRQAFLVHPDKNQQPGAEEAFKILVHAFNMIGEPERRQAYDRGVAESAQVEQAWSELTELLAQLQQKVEAAANTIRCSACGLRHKRIKVDRPSYAARNCTQCKIHHSAREGDIWAEARCFGFLWHYYACMDGGVYDITEWAGCQKDSLKHLKPDSHHVQYRISLGKQNSGSSRRQSSSPRNDRSPDLENLLNSLYGQPDNSQSNRRRNKKK